MWGGGVGGGLGENVYIHSGPEGTGLPADTVLQVEKHDQQGQEFF